jgi:hypothetical protein
VYIETKRKTQGMPSGVIAIKELGTISVIYGPISNESLS